MPTWKPSVIRAPLTLSERLEAERGRKARKKLLRDLANPKRPHHRAALNFLASVREAAR